MTQDDHDAVEAMRLLATGSELDIPVVSGESGAAGLAGFMALRNDAKASAAVGLDSTSRILVINTEAATAPSVYQDLVFEAAASVLERQTAWLNSQPT